MKLICAWCGCLLKGDDGNPKPGISHGICLPCAQTLRANLLTKVPVHIRPVPTSATVNGKAVAA